MQQNNSQSNPPIIYTKLAKAHVSYDTYKILYHFDVDYVYHTSDRIDAIRREAKSLCKQTRGEYCQVALQQMDKNRLITLSELQRIEVYGARRFKRHCNWCGNFLHWSTGVMNADTAILYDEKINELQNATLTQHDLMKNQTYIVATTFKVNTRALEKMGKAIYEMNAKLNKTTELELEAELGIRFGEMIQMMSLMDAEQHEIVRQMKQTLVEARSRRVPEIIDEMQLNTDIKNIHNGLSENQALPIDFKNENAMAIFKYATTAATKYKNRIMVEIAIPITSREKFSLFKAVGVPFKINEFTLIPKLQSKYFLLNIDETKFIALDEADLETGLKIQENEVIYRPTAIVRFDRNNICEWRILSEISAEETLKICEVKQIPSGDYIFEINENNVYYVSVSDELKYTMSCGDQKTIKESIKRDTILKIQPNCVIKTQNFIIQPHNTYILNETQLSSPTIFKETISETELEQWLNKNLTKIIINEPILITEFSQLHNLIEEADQMSTRADYELKLKEIHYDTNSRFMFWILITVGSLLILGALVVWYLIHKIGLADIILGPEAAVARGTTEILLNNVNRRLQTPHPGRKIQPDYEEPI